MKKEVFNASDFESLIEQHNPFAIKDTDGKIQFFKDYEEVYIYVLNVLDAYFKRGYVDIILLVNVLTQLPVRDCEMLFRQMQSLWGKNSAKLIDYHWGLCCANNDGGVADIMRCLHLITETRFDAQAFDKACDMFRLKLARENRIPF